MEGGILRLLFSLLLCSPGAVLSGEEHGRGPGPRKVSESRGRYPLYMMQLYRSFRADDSSSGASGGAGSRQDSDSVLSLTARGCSQLGERWTVTFDISSLSATQLVQRAELRIRLPALSGSGRATVDLYHSGKQSCAPCGERRLFLGSFSASTASRSSWEVFDVTALLRSWLSRGGMASEQEASGEPEGDQGSGGEEQGVAGRVQHPTSNRVAMVIFSKYDAPREGKAAYSLLHAVGRSKHVAAGGADRDGQGRRHKRNKMERLREAEGGAAAAAEAAAAVQRCRRVDMWVDFDHIGWDAWIVHPKRFNAYRCEGECPAPLDESFNPSNHAYMQSLLRHHHPHRVSCPSCVPTRLSPLSMLYFESDDLTLRHHEDMIVEECGCQ